MKDITIAAPFVQQALAGARDAGYDIGRILYDCDISPQVLTESRRRIALDRFVRLHRRVMQLMNDEAMGLLERPQRIGTFGMVARSVLHGSTLGDAMSAYANAFSLLENGFDHEVQRTGGRATYILHRRSSHAARNDYIAESSALTAHRFFCWLCQSRIPLTRVTLDYPAPEWQREYRFLFYGAPVAFRGQHIAMEFRLDDLELPVRRDIRSLTTYLERAPRDLFGPQVNRSLTYQVRRQFLRSIESGKGVPPMAVLAAAVGLHPQTLRRRLSRENSRYADIRTEARRDAAIHMLVESKAPIEDIAEHLGFSESSAFVRAFKSWMGVTPNAYRRS